MNAEPASTELLAELARYRGHYGFATLHYDDETTPLLVADWRFLPELAKYLVAHTDDDTVLCT
jgi:hypothetical protein